MAEIETIWGAAAIAEATGLAVRSVYHLVGAGSLPGARHIGGKLALHLPSYRASFAAAPALKAPQAPHAPTPKARAKSLESRRARQQVTT